MKSREAHDYVETRDQNRTGTAARDNLVCAWCARSRSSRARLDSVSIAVEDDSVTTGAFDIDDPVADADTDVYHVAVPAGTKAARFSLDSADDTADLDLFVYLGGDLVDLSASGSADEQVTLLNPAEGTYDVYVNGFATPGAATSSYRQRTRATRL